MEAEDEGGDVDKFRRWGVMEAEDESESVGDGNASGLGGEVGETAGLCSPYPEPGGE
jgi:hypothetical protein